MLRQISDLLIRIVGLVLISSAYFWQFNSLKVIEFFGIADPNVEKAVLGPAIGSRNAAAGMMLLILSMKGHRKLAGTFLFVWVTLVGPEDIFLCMKDGTSWDTHAINLGIGWVISVLSWCV
ncbi:hypothetical protein F1880_003925 [Penicillium rolfsii]|nr:hypothetical protein F1880_003925 [Penicillium rolfsii]